MSDSPIILISITTIVLFIYSIYTLFQLLLALRAKARVQGALKAIAHHDRRLAQALREINAGRMDDLAVDVARASVEQVISELKLAERDKDFVREGLHQFSRRGAFRFLKEVASVD